MRTARPFRLPHRRAATALAAALALVPLAGCGADKLEQTGGGLTELDVSVSQKVADVLPLWIAQEAGYFKDEGLKVSLRNLPSSQGIPALVSGQVDLASMGSGEVVSAQDGGTDIKYIATFTPTFSFEFYSTPAIRKDPRKLKGQRIGITSTSGSVYLATLQALEKYGLTKNDVQLVPLKTSPNVDAALLSGNIKAAVSHPPATVKFKEAGLVRLLDLAQQKIPFAQNGAATTAAFAEKHGDETQKFTNALYRAILREKSDRAFAEKVLGKYLGLDDSAALRTTYDYYAKEVLPDDPSPTTGQFDLSVKSLDAGGVDSKDIVDDAFVTKAMDRISKP